MSRASWTRRRPAFSRALRSSRTTPRHTTIWAACQEQGKLAEAVASYERAAGPHGPNYAEAHNNLGPRWQEQGKLDEAVGQLSASPALKPDYADAHQQPGRRFHDAGKLADAVACCERALALKPDYAEAHNQSRTGPASSRVNWPRRRPSFQQALRLKPDFAEAHSNLGNAFKARGRGEGWRRP